jgi:hypothetical protein
MLAGDCNEKEMNKEFSNVYDDQVRAAAYAGLEYPGTYGLGFRDLPLKSTSTSGPRFPPGTFRKTAPREVAIRSGS